MTKHSHTHRPIKKARSPWVEKPVSAIPLASQLALKKAMELEQVPANSYDDLAWIMAQESTGVVNARNAHSTARGLFQLLHEQYSLNPHGVKSFGNAVEEAQGGIHYIMGRYNSASAAKAFWQKHHWY